MNPSTTLRAGVSLSSVELLTAGAVLFAVTFATLLAPAQPLLNSLERSLTTNPITAPLTSVENQAETAIAKPIADLFYGARASTDEAVSTINKQVAYVSSRNAYPASLNVIKEYGPQIEAKANEIGVPADVAVGVAFLENGGSVTAKSPAGALGVYQLMPGTARNLGLTVSKKQDDRLNPTKSIEAGITYLKANYDRFGDWGLATWAYHAGEGNVAHALQIYAQANDGITLPKGTDWSAYKDYVTSHGITIDKLLSDSNVQKFTDKLHDDSSGYPYKVIATASLYRQNK